MTEPPHKRRTRAPGLAALDGVPFALAGWIAEHMAGDLGPVGNKEVFRHSDFIFMIVKGPNARNDFHIDPYDEIFYQLQGSVRVALMDPDGRPRTAEVREGEVMLVRAGTPHSPRRPPGTLGLVVERPRVPGERDGIVWYCEGCGHMLHEVFLLCEDIETQLKAELERFNDSLALRTCARCGAVLPDPRETPPWRAPGGG
jgi:3-hydroxyanthranilate 3,4-dioxygenase